MKSSMFSRRGRLLALAASTLAVFASAACSVEGGSGDTSDFPSQPIQITVGADAGGSTDLLTRALAKAAEDPLGESITVINQAGANGKIAGKDVSGSEPDGYKLAMMPQSLFSVGPLFIDDSDPLEIDDMTVIAGLAVEDYVLVVPADSEYKTFDDLMNADELKYGTSGVGTGAQLAQTLLFGLEDIDATDVPFDGGAPNITALLGNKIDVAAAQVGEALPHIDSGKLKPLAVFSSKRLDALPDVPTAKEFGYDVVVDQRRFLAGPPDMPDDVVNTLHDAVIESTRDSDYQDLMESNAMTPWNVDGDATVKQIGDSMDGFKKMADDLGITLMEE